MNSVAYYPGCTLNTTAKNFDRSARESMKALGWELAEMPKWNCCGTVYSLASDNLINHVAPIRLLVRAQEEGHDKLATLCSMCYHTIKMANWLVHKEPDKLEKINFFMEPDPPYQGKVEILHLLEILKKDIGFEAVKSKVTKPLTGLKLDCYYGCLLTRPKEAALDDMEQPAMMDDLMKALGAEAVYDPYLTECCGSYHTVMDKDIVVDKAGRIIASARKKGAEAVVTSCPLCFFNLDQRQKDIQARTGKAPGLPILYFTQLMALALGLSPDVCMFDVHYVDPRLLLKAKSLL